MKVRNPSEHVNHVSLLPMVRVDEHANPDTHDTMEFEETENDASGRNESLPIVHKYDFENPHNDVDVLDSQSLGD